MRSNVIPAACAALLVCGACSSGTSEPGKSATSEAAIQAETTPTSRENTLPIGAEPVKDIYLTAERKYLLEKRVTELQNDCFKQSGLPPKQTISKEAFIKHALKANSVVYGITDKETASQFGFSVPTNQSSTNNTSGDIKPLPNYTTQSPEVFIEEDKNLTGENKGKEVKKGKLELCIEYVNKEVFGDAAGSNSPYSFGTQLFMKAWKATIEDARVKKLWDQWKKCMEQSGYHNIPGDPVDPKMYPARTDSATASSGEIKAAIQDIDCKEQVNLVSKWAPIVREKVLELRRQNTEQVQRTLSSISSLRDAN